MDSLTQLVLGAAVGVAVMRRRTAVWKAAAWGGVAGTLPDLDVLVSYGDPILDMVLHRADSHAVFWQTLLSLPLAWGVAWLHGERRLLRRWWLAIWLALVTHPLLDVLTVYGTQIGRPFTEHPYAVGSVFIIDPVVTLAWLTGLACALAMGGSQRGQRANLYGLAVGVAYLGLAFVLQGQTAAHARASLAAQGIAAERMLVTPAAFTALLWRVVVIDGDSFHEGFHGVFDPPGPMRFDRFDRGEGLEPLIAGSDGAQRLRAFSHGFYKLHVDDGRVVISDLRMGQEPGYVFAFAVADTNGRPLPAVAVGGRVDLEPALRWLWRRVRGELLPPPR